MWKEVANFLERSNFVIGLVVGCFLLYCIIYETRADMGYFKYLQILFVINDISFSISAFLLEEKILTHDFKFCLIILGGENQFLVYLFCSFYCSIIIIVALNFLYRLWVLQWPEKARLFGKVWFHLLLFSIASAIHFACAHFMLCACLFLFVATPVAREELKEQLMTKYSVGAMAQPMIIGDYWRDNSLNLRPLCGLAVFVVIIGSVVGLVIYSSLAIVFYLRKAKVLSEKTRQLQYALFRALFIQATIPIVLVHGCSGTQLTLPLFGVNIALYSDLSTTLLSFLTPLDSLAVILLMKDYRRATICFLKCRKVRTLATEMMRTRQIHAEG